MENPAESCYYWPRVAGYPIRKHIAHNADETGHHVLQRDIEPSDDFSGHVGKPDLASRIPRGG